MPNNIVPSEFNIVVVGGGIAGCGAALRLADLGYKVTLIENRGSLLSGSSDDTPCRAGLGFHYPDKNTAVSALKNAVRFIKEYKDLGFNLRVGEDKPLAHPLRRGHYYVVKDSQFEVDTVLALYEEIKKAYAKLIEEDPANEVFGPAEDFYRVLWRNEEGDVPAEHDALVPLLNLYKIACGIETAEHTLNWPVFKSYLVDEVTHHPNITVQLNTQVNEILPHGLGYKINFEENAELKNKKCDFVINSAWENIEKLNKTAGVEVHPEDRVLRVKVICQIKLPEELRDKPSAFFCFGPHCSLTNTGDGYGWLSFEPVTNIKATNCLTLDPELALLVQGLATDEQKRNYGERIIDGAAKYLHALQKAEYVSARIGVVRTLGNAAPITDAASPIHHRDYLAVQTALFGLVTNPCTKLLCWMSNADVVEKLCEAFARARTVISETVTANLCEQDPVLEILLVDQLKQILLPQYNELSQRVENALTDLTQESVANKLAMTTEGHKRMMKELRSLPRQFFEKTASSSPRTPTDFNVSLHDSGSPASSPGPSGPSAAS